MRKIIALVFLCGLIVASETKNGNSSAFDYKDEFEIFKVRKIKK